MNEGIYIEKEYKKMYIQKCGSAPMILGLCTDSRNPKRTYLDAKNKLMKNEDYESQYCYFNLFTIGCIKVNGELTTSIDELLDKLEVAVKIRVGESRTLISEELDLRSLRYKRGYRVNCNCVDEYFEEVIPNE